MIVVEPVLESLLVVEPMLCNLNSPPCICVDMLGDLLENPGESDDPF
jgi:hypothetical protein